VGPRHPPVCPSVCLRSVAGSLSLSPPNVMHSAGWPESCPLAHHHARCRLAGAGLERVCGSFA